MSAQRNKAALRRIIDEAWNGGNVAVMDELLAPDSVNHTPQPGLPPDREGRKMEVMGFHAAFPDGEIAITDEIAEGDTVVIRATITGTHRGPLGPIPHRPQPRRHRGRQRQGGSVPGAISSSSMWSLRVAGSS